MLNEHPAIIQDLFYGSMINEGINARNFTGLNRIHCHILSMQVLVETMLGTLITGIKFQHIPWTCHATVLLVHVHHQTDHFNQSKKENNLQWPLIVIKETIWNKLIHYYNSPFSHHHLIWAVDGTIYEGGAITNTEAVISVLQ